MAKSRIFISHSSNDKKFAQLVAKEIKKYGAVPWIDHEQIFVGDDIFEKLEEGLTSMDVLLLLISREALDSGWVALEVNYAVWKELNERRPIIHPFRLSDIPIKDLPWFIQTRHIPVVTQDEEGASLIVNNLITALKRRLEPETLEPKTMFQRDSRVEELIKDVRLGDWDLAQVAALKMLCYTNEDGYNELFYAMIKYLDSPNENLRWGAIQTIESFSDLAPWLFDKKLLTKLSKHSDFSVRSMVAMICYNLAHWAPHLVPINVLFKLADPNEDYYVNNPAMAALKTLAKWRPIIIRLLYLRLRSTDAWTREFVAHAIYDISLKEPEILNIEELREELERLKSINDKTAIDYLTKAIKNIKPDTFGDQWKYSPF